MAYLVSTETQEIVQKSEELRQECGTLIQKLSQESKFKRNIQGEQEAWSVSAASAEASGRMWRLNVRPPIYTVSSRDSFAAPHAILNPCLSQEDRRSLPLTGGDLRLENKGF